jgi:leader peptidase (prepilin peptidase)/N-methyltransferase
MISESFSANLFALAGTLYLIAVAWPLSRIDMREHRLPNRLVLPAFPITLAGEVIASAISNNWANLGVALAACVISFAIGLAANHWASLGMGDVKLISATTLALGWFSFISPLVALAIAFLSASLVVLVLIALRRASLGSAVALGPYLLVGFVLTQILTWSTYLGGFSPSFFV